MTTRKCTHPGGCDRPHKAHGWCRAHWDRVRSSGDPGPARIATKRSSNRECSIDGCTNAVGRSARDMCNQHYLRWRTHRDPTVVAKGGASLPLDRNPNWSGDEATYDAVHRRLAKQRGSASWHDCVDCGSVAAHWSYDNSGRSERTDPDGYRYSTNLDAYEPRCVPCHRNFDNRARALLTGQRPEED